MQGMTVSYTAQLREHNGSARLTHFVAHVDVVKFCSPELYWCGALYDDTVNTINPVSPSDKGGNHREEKPAWARREYFK